MSVITISREFGCGGSSIAEQVAQALGYHFVDKDTIARVLNQYGLPEFKEEYDAAPPSFWARFDAQRMERREVIASLLNQTLLALAQHGRMVIVGRCGYAVLPGYADVLHVRLQAPLPFRVRRLMEKQSLTDYAAAEAVVKEGDKIRAGFAEAYYGVKWDAIGAFDVVINTSKISDSLAAGWLVAAAQSLKGRQAGEDLSAHDIVADRTLAAAISYELQCEAIHAD
jgi:cytidylate kinase